MVLVSSSTAAIKRMFSSTRDEGDARDEAPVPACFMIQRAGTREAEGNMASWTGGFTTIANLPVWSAESTYFWPRAAGAQGAPASATTPATRRWRLPTPGWTRRRWGCASSIGAT